MNETSAQVLVTLSGHDSLTFVEVCQLNGLKDPLLAGELLRELLDEGLIQRVEISSFAITNLGGANVNQVLTKFEEHTAPKSEPQTPVSSKEPISLPTALTPAAGPCVIETDWSTGGPVSYDPSTMITVDGKYVVRKTLAGIWLLPPPTPRIAPTKPNRHKFIPHQKEEPPEVIPW
ncbi:MAG TPA: hypothetical protein VGR53_06950 [Nitrososphaerales archaeon]|nr:hypothetical protein [Nitrososphaerales archaeon]